MLFRSPTKARLALVNAAPESPTTASPAISTAISGAKNNAPPAVAAVTASVATAAAATLFRLPVIVPIAYVYAF